MGRGADMESRALDVYSGVGLNYSSARMRSSGIIIAL